MTDNGNRNDGPTLPEDIAAQAGLPRADTIVSAPEQSERHRVGPSGSFPSSPASPLEASNETAETAARRAANAASDFRDRVADASFSAKERARDTVQKARNRASDAYEDARDWTADRYDEQRRRAQALADRVEEQKRRASAFAERGYDRVQHGRHATEDFVAENPLIVGVVGLAAGLLLGALLPRTRQEDRAIGPWADEVRDQGLRYARDLTHRGREFVETALDPDNLDAAARRTGFAPQKASGAGYEGGERTAHRL